MKPGLVDLLVCPDCNSSLDLQSQQERAGEIVEGTLTCRGCLAAYPITRGVPRFVPPSIGSDQRETAEAFGWEWQRFTELDAPYEEQFLDWIYPLERSFFQGKLVLDAGCGMGRWSVTAAGFGAREVIGVDISTSVEVAQRRAAVTPNMHVVQADINRLPFGKSFDFAYSIGVLHHMPDPEAGFHSIVRSLAPGGSVHAWVYGRENNEWLVRFGNPIRERVSSRLPANVLFVLSWMVTAAMHPALKLLYRPRPASRPLARSWLPYYGYLSWLAKYSLQHNHHVVFDHLVAPTARYLRKEEFAAWFERAGLKNVHISWRNQNSWRGYGEL